MKIIDCHAHMAVPHQLGVYKASLLSHRGAHRRKAPPVTKKRWGRLSSVSRWRLWATSLP